MSAIFRETDGNLPAERRQWPDLAWVDVGLVLFGLLLAIGLALVWLPLAFIVPGAIGTAVCLWRVIR